jgi:hypothetical protein
LPNLETVGSICSHDIPKLEVEVRVLGEQNTFRTTAGFCESSALKSDGECTLYTVSLNPFRFFIFAFDEVEYRRD